MNHSNHDHAEFDQIEEDTLYEVSDEALEAAAGYDAMAQTVTATWICSGIWCPT